MGKTNKEVNIPQQSTTAVMNLPVPPSRKAGDYLKAYSSWTYGAVSAIAQEVANINLKLFKRTYKGKEVIIEQVHEHEALSLLHFVNTCDFNVPLTLLFHLHLGHRIQIVPST